MTVRQLSAQQIEASHLQPDPMPLAAASATTNQHYQTQLGMWCKEALGGHPKMKEYVVKDWRALEHTLKMLKIGQTVDIPLAVPLEGEAGKPYFTALRWPARSAFAMEASLALLALSRMRRPKRLERGMSCRGAGGASGSTRQIKKKASGRNGGIRARLPSSSLPLRISRLWVTSTVWSGS